MNLLTKKDSRDKVLLVLTFVALSASSLAWAHADRTPPPWDPSDHLRFAYDYYQPLAHFHLKDFYREFFFAEHFYAPLVHLLTAFFFLIFGASEMSGIAVNLLSLAVLMASVYWMGRHLFVRKNGPAERAGAAQGIESAGEETEGKVTGQPRGTGLPFSAGALAAVVVACYHFPAWLLHDAFLDFPLIAAVAATFALLIRADDFKDRRRALQFGVAAGLGLLVKETFPFFFLLPALYVVARVLIGRSSRSITNLALAAFVAAAIASIWYLPHLGDVSKIYQINTQAAVEENEAPIFSFMSNVVYLHGLVSYQIQALFAGMFGIGLLYSLTRKARESVMLYLWVLSGIVAFTLLANKDMRYTIPILPAVALLSVCWADEFPARLPKFFTRGVDVEATTVEPGPSIWPRSILSWLKAMEGTLSAGTKVSGFAIAGLILGFSFVSFTNAQWPSEGNGDYIDTPHFRWMIFARNYFLFDHRPLPEDWSVAQIAQTLTKLGEQKAPPNLVATSDRRAPVFASGSAASAPLTVGVFVNLPYLNPSSVALYGRLGANPRAAPAPFKVEWLVEPDRLKFIPKCQYFLVRTELDRAEWVAPLERYAEKLIREQPQKYVLVARFPIPRSESQALLYRVEE